MRVLGRYLIIPLLTCSLAACVTSETRSIVGQADLPTSRYRNVAVFIENLDDGDRPIVEGIVTSTLQGAGINAVSGPNIFKGRGGLNEQSKAAIVQKEFDAVLYLTVVEKGVVEEIVPNASFDGQMIHYNMGIISVGHNVTDLFITKPDGSVYQSILALKTKVDFQDTKTAKQVWTSETISTGHANVSNMRLLFEQASKQIVEKMRADNAI